MSMTLETLQKSFLLFLERCRRKLHRKCAKNNLPIEIQNLPHGKHTFYPFGITQQYTDARKIAIEITIILQYIIDMSYIYYIQQYYNLSMTHNTMRHTLVYYYNFTTHQ